MHTSSNISFFRIDYCYLAYRAVKTWHRIILNGFSFQYFIIPFLYFFRIHRETLHSLLAQFANSCLEVFPYCYDYREGNSIFIKICFIHADTGWLYLDRFRNLCDNFWLLFGTLGRSKCRGKRQSEDWCFHDYFLDFFSSASMLFFKRILITSTSGSLSFA